MLERLAVGIDVGGTKLAAGVVDEDGAVVARARRSTPRTDAAAVEDAIAEMVDELSDVHPVVAVGIGAAGFVDRTRSTVLFSPHLAWRHEPLRDAVRRRVGLATLVENDANAAAWAEWRFGAGQHESDLVCVNLGTGIGGAMVFDGRLHRGRHGMAGEFGHTEYVRDGRPCECGRTGCWEQYASGNALGRRGRELAAAGRAPTLLDAAGGDPGAITGVLVGRLATDGDPLARELVAEVGEYLGRGISDLVATFDPGLVVVGGGVSETGDLLLEPTRAAFRDRLTGRGFRPEARIVPAHLGNDAGLVGAADLARQVARRRIPRSSRALAREGRVVRPTARRLERDQGGRRGSARGH